jgi:hypothetical protein
MKTKTNLLFCQLVDSLPRTCLFKVCLSSPTLALRLSITPVTTHSVAMVAKYESFYPRIGASRELRVLREPTTGKKQMQGTESTPVHHSSAWNLPSLPLCCCFSFCENPSHIGLGPILRSHFNVSAPAKTVRRAHSQVLGSSAYLLRNTHTCITQVWVSTHLCAFVYVMVYLVSSRTPSNQDLN